ELKMLLEELKKWSIHIEDEQALRLTISERIFLEIQKLDFAKGTENQFELINQILLLLQESGLKVDLWKSQNLFFQKLESNHKKIKNQTDFQQFSELLNIQI
ncbi:MAG: hypothetical protein RJA52_1342, partial [Bacteroidota bacterium]